ncbi:hypothetical protein N9N28_14165 [Rubripirellula amarantea]|uniref:Uncharacterized protein n=1 Tax=Rubripirellula amarantea TaxID=2527999 RepID=A0A5C5WXF2_9BACT|nr:hypothetical protein [Rubripirellula amarantea]MDA8745773.1 hypothetical protein [Rubripirellula amarantea]TWT54552.1 hypothetical protein Pla22_22000 [Rubripirellula amarantea]
MSKFYVQCGPVEVVLTADTVEQAALNAVDRSLQNHLWIYDDAGLSERDCHDHLMLEALMHMAPTIRVSERGFASVDQVNVDDGHAHFIGTPETVEHWHQLMVGMSRLFVAAGLTPRSMEAVAGFKASEQPSPRLPR